MNEYLENILPAPFTILGKRLRPLSIGRALLLNRFECYPVTDFPKLVTAIIICSRPYHDAVDALLNDRWLGWKIRLWAIRLKKFDPVQKVVFFNEYIRAYSGRPNFFGVDSFEEGLVPGAPFLQHMRVVLRSRMGWSQSEIEEAPLAQAHWDYYSYWESEDIVRITELGGSFEQSLAEEADARHDERLAKAGGAKFFAT